MMAAAALFLLVAGTSDVPRIASTHVSQLLLSSADTTLQNARRLADQLRFEEAMVEYHRYLGDPARPARERARAMLELAFIHLVLGDEPNAQRRATEALELDPAISLPADAPQKHAAFLASMRQQIDSRARLEVIPRASTDAPEEIRAKLTDPEKKVSRVWLRHALAKSGPYHGTLMRCSQDICAGSIPPPAGASAFTAFYYLEADDPEGNTVAQAGTPGAPLQLSVIQKSPWYRSPYVWGGGAALIIGAAAIFFIASNPGATP